ncbi:P-type conjugative transfer protein TrbL [Acidovorax sp. SUPP2522]|uniref:P-type conjugative transfer protein TrbL n=1 Tax=unclassified Acidovorax TaxID=2684926 RepID=UPI00234BAC3F|nr:MULTISPECIES: P-type conjugative transfer protein TrbL [unclassified Acidovorax]WCM99441.1 P-type conjugative transfer protein TrbL [Acidovorax sp. GBBC 1281]GKT16299.1 P-type conjugative transfer protein TrbL [Acidovorax sp. SUPP2522]
MKTLHKPALLIGAFLALFCTAASAQLTNQGMLDQVVTEFATRATAWQTVVMNAAMFLFWTLGTISMVVTFGFMALRKADIGEFFAEFIKFILFFGFFLWLLRNGPNFATSIIQSLARIGEQASGFSSITPSSIVDVGFMIWKQAIRNLSAWSPIDSFIGAVLSAGILLLLAVIAVNMLLLLVSGWLLSYAGIFFLGFGGSRWTSDMAINYYKTVLGVAVQIMTMVLLVGIGNDLLSSFYARMNTGTLNFEELGVMLVFCLALLMLVNRVPPLVAGVITGSSVGGAGGIGNFGAGAAMGAVMGAATMAAGAASVAGSAVLGGAASAAGGASAIKAAYSKASAASSESGGGGGMGGTMGGVAMAAAGPSDGSSGSGSVFAGMDTGSSSGGGFGGGASEGDSAGGKSSAPAGEGKDSGGGAAPGAAEGKADAGGKAAGSDAKGGGQGTGLAPGEQRTTGSMLGGAAAIAAGTAGNLAQGSWDVAKAKAASMRGSALDRISETTGGKIASAIRASRDQEGASHDDPAFDSNSLGKAPIADDEVAAFVSRRPQ